MDTDTSCSSDFFSGLSARRHRANKPQDLKYEVSSYVDNGSDCLASLYSLYPHICQLYVELNTWLSSSAAVERLFSLEGRVFFPLRSRMSSAHFWEGWISSVSKVVKLVVVTWLVTTAHTAALYCCNLLDWFVKSFFMFAVCIMTTLDNPLNIRCDISLCGPKCLIWINVWFNMAWQLKLIAVTICSIVARL